MIKWPEPYMIQRDFVNNTYVNHNLYTESQLKQAVRGALQHAIDEIKAEADYSGSNRKAVLTWSIDKLRALIKEIQ